MHLKNFSLYSPEPHRFVLTPAYDMISTTLVMPDDKEELALTLNGKKAKITRDDFAKSMLASGLEQKVTGNIFSKFEKLLPKWEKLILVSFIDEEIKNRYIEAINSNLIID